MGAGHGNSMMKYKGISDGISNINGENNGSHKPNNFNEYQHIYNDL